MCTGLGTGYMFEASTGEDLGSILPTTCHPNLLHTFRLLLLVPQGEDCTAPQGWTKGGHRKMGSTALPSHELSRHIKKTKNIFEK